MRRLINWIISLFNTPKIKGDFFSGMERSGFARIEETDTLPTRVFAYDSSGNVVGEITNDSGNPEGLISKSSKPTNDLKAINEERVKWHYMVKRLELRLKTKNKGEPRPKTKVYKSKGKTYVGPDEKK